MRIVIFPIMCHLPRGDKKNSLLITKGNNFCINLHNLLFKLLSAPVSYSLNSFQPFLSIILLNER